MVEIPDDVAKRLAAHLRHEDGYVSVADANRWADLLDPKPPTLREQVAQFLDSLPTDFGDGVDSSDAYAGDLLAVVADWLAAQPLWQSADTGVPQRQRDHDVHLLLGKA